MAENSNLQATTNEASESINWERVQIWIQTGILFLMGLYLIDLALSGNLSNYINVDNFGWLTWVGAIILFAIAGANMVELMTKANPDDASHQDPLTDDPYARRLGGTISSWVFLGLVSVPLILGLGVPSQPLGADAVGNLSSDVSTIGGGDFSAADIPPENRNLLDWVRVFAASPDMSEFEGETVDVIGFVYKDARFAGTENFMVVRFTLSCCVADARPIGLVVDNINSVQLDQDTWVRITGRVVVRDVDGVETPMILTDSIEITEQPEQPYLYF